MKRWTYIFGFLFAACLLAAMAFKVDHRALPDALFYLFVIITLVFFTMLIFTAMQRFRR